MIEPLRLKVEATSFVDDTLRMRTTLGAEVLSEKVVELGDGVIRRALIDLGWTPPGESGDLDPLDEAAVCLARLRQVQESAYIRALPRLGKGSEVLITLSSAIRTLEVLQKQLEDNREE